MTPRDETLGLSFWGRWVLASAVAWVVGMLGAIVLSYALVNPFYPEETNLIVGLCMGAAVGWAQARAARPWFVPGRGWTLGAMVAMGVPFIFFVIFDEMGISTESGSGMWLMGALVTIGGITGAVLQSRALRSVSSRAGLWVLGALISWGVAWPVDGLLGFPSGGLAMGAVGGGLMIWITRGQVNPPEDSGPPL